MDPYRKDPGANATAARGSRDLALPLVIAVIGALGLAIGLTCDRTVDAGVGTLLAIFGVWAFVRAARGTQAAE